MKFILDMFRRFRFSRSHDDNLRADDVGQPIGGYAVLYKDKMH